MSKSSDASPVSGFFGPGAGKRGAHVQAAAGAIVQAHSTMRRNTPVKTARARVEAPADTVRRRPARPIGPTPERLAKGDIPLAATAGGFHRSVPPVERLFKTNKLSEHCSRENYALFQAAERLKHHFDRKSALGIQAQDLSRVTGGSSASLAEEESWVGHNKYFANAMTLMGYWPASPTRGSAKIVEAVVCHEMAVTDAAEAILAPARKEVMVAAAMEKLRQGLFVLAVHWGMLR